MDTATASLTTVRTLTELRETIAAWRAQGKTVGLVPTMGALHEGHLTLVRRALEMADRVVATVFVNPTQFGPNEDFSRYPRAEFADASKLQSAGCHVLYAPAVDDVYPSGFSTKVNVGPLSTVLEGAFRPGHFDGVATVVTKLLLRALPDVACFGQKDYQQLQVIQRFVRDLDVPVRIEGVPTVRESDGLALSSRNIYLSPEDRARAVALPRALQNVIKHLKQTPDAVEIAVAEGKAAMLKAGFDRIDYLAVCDATTLEPLTVVDRPARVLVAAWMGTTRLIDNMAL